MRHTGRPSGETGKELLAHLKTLSQSSLLPEEDPNPQWDPSQASLGANLCCPICMAILDRPVQLLCGAVVCFNCCSTWIQFCPTLCCPCCYSHSLSSLTVKQPSSLLTSLLQDLLVLCKGGCGKLVKLVQYKQHLKGKCKSHYDRSIHSPSRMTIQDVLSRPTSSPATPAEVKVAEHLVRKLMDPSTSSTQGVLKVKTSGQVYKHYIA